MTAALFRIEGVAGISRTDLLAAGPEVVQVGEDLVDDHGIFDTGDDSERTGALRANLDIDIEDTLQPLRPGHRGPAFCWGSRLVLLSRSPCAALASFRWRNLNAVFAIRGEDAVESGQVDPRLGDQSCQAGQKVKWAVRLNRFSRTLGTISASVPVTRSASGQDVRYNTATGQSAP